MKKNYVYNNCMYMYRLIWSISKTRIALILVLSVADAINVFVTTFFFKFAIDGLTNQKPFSYFITIVGIRIGYLLIYQCIDNFFHTVVFPIYDNKIKQNISLNLYRKVSNIDLYQCEQSEFYKKYARAINEADNRAIEMLGTLRGFLSITLQAIVLLSVLAYISPITIFIALVGTGVTFWGNIMNTKKVYKYENDKREINRFIDYIKRIYYLPQYSKDIRTTIINDILSDAYTSRNTNLNEVIKKQGTIIALVAIIASWLFNFINIGLSSIYLGLKILKGFIGVGDFVSSINAISNLSGNMLMMSNIIPQFRQHALFIDDYLSIINYQSSLYDNVGKNFIKTNEPHSISIRNVSFSYPNKKGVLKNINIEIGKGQKIAFVGENGAGKSTLLKLIMRLYDPECGELYIDEIPYKEINVSNLYDSISAIYQDYQCYAFSLRDNITLINNKVNYNKIREAIIKSGLETLVNSLNNDLSISLSTEFDSEGVNLSGGQCQKVAIARSLYHNAGIIIMDEPTAALDPLAEKDLFDIIDGLAANKTLIVVSHRLSLVKNMDKIYHIKNGQVVEKGTHNELMALGGEYSHMFKVQAERYGL